MDTGIFFPETVEEQLFIAAGCIECSLDWLYIGIVILHIVGENHQLRDVYKSAEHLSGEPGIDSVMFCDNAILIVRLFHLYKGQRHTIDQQNDVRPEFVITISVSKFCYNMKVVSAVVFKINQAIAIDSIEQDIVKSTAQIVIGQFNGQFCQQCIYIMIRKFLAVNSRNAVTE